MVAQIDAKYRSYGAAKTLRRLVSYALFEGRPHTTKGQWFNPVVFALLGTLKRIPSSNPVDRPIFITGLGRSGTTILGLLLSVHRDVGYLNEPKAIWKVVDSRSDVLGDYVLEGGQFRLSPADAGIREQPVAQRIFGHYLSVVRSSRLVDKYPELIFRVDYVRQLFPDARFVFISRNGADAVHSIDLWSKRLGTSTDARTEDWWGRNDIKWKNLWEELIEPDAYFGSIAGLDRDGLDHVNRAALEWIVTMREGLEQVSRNPNCVYWLKYESLVAEPKTTMQQLLSFLQLADDGNVSEYADFVLDMRPSKAWPSLHPSIEPLFRETMNRLGYSEAGQQ